jgi:hypothetical protein
MASWHFTRGPPTFRSLLTILYSSTILRGHTYNTARLSLFDSLSTADPRNSSPRGMR